MITSDFIREWKCSQHADRQLLLTLTQRFHHKHVKLQHFLIHEFSRGSASAAENLTETILFSWSTADHCEHHGDDRQRDASPVVTLYTNADTECVTLDPTHSSNMTWMHHGPGSNIKAGWASRARCEGGNGLKTHFHRLRDTFACYYTEIAARPNQKGFLKSRFFRLPTWSLSCSSSRRKTQQLLQFHHTHLMLQVKHRGPNRTWWWDLTQNKDNWFMIIFIISRQIKMSASRVSVNDTNVQMCAGSLHTLTDGWLSFQEVDGQSVTAGPDRCWARVTHEAVWTSSCVINNLIYHNKCWWWQTFQFFGSICQFSVLGSGQKTSCLGSNHTWFCLHGHSWRFPDVSHNFIHYQVLSPNTWLEINFLL